MILDHNFSEEHRRHDITKARRIRIELLKDDLIAWLLEMSRPRQDFSACIALNADILEKIAALRALMHIEDTYGP